MRRPELPYRPKSLTLLAIVLNLFEDARSPVQCSKPIYWQNKYSVDTIIQAIANVYQEGKCVQYAITVIAHSFFCLHFC